MEEPQNDDHTNHGYKSYRHTPEFLESIYVLISISGQNAASKGEEHDDLLFGGGKKKYEKIGEVEITFIKSTRLSSAKIKSGKEIYSDLKQGLITAPTLFALKSADKRAKQLEKLIENQFDGSDATLSQAIRIIFELGSCEKAEALAKEYIVQAKENLDFIKDIYLKETLEKAADFVLNRA